MTSGGCGYCSRRTPQSDHFWISVIKLFDTPHLAMHLVLICGPREYYCESTLMSPMSISVRSWLGYSPATLPRPPTDNPLQPTAFGFIIAEMPFITLFASSRPSVLRIKDTLSPFQEFCLDISPVYSAEICLMNASDEIESETAFEHTKGMFLSS